MTSSNFWSVENGYHLRAGRRFTDEDQRISST